MKFIRFYSMLLLLCLIFPVQRMNAQCNGTLSAVVTDIACFGDAGAIDLTVTGGTAPFTYNWSNGQTDEDLDGLTAGLYIVTVTDNLGCIINLARSVDGPTDALNLVLNDDGVLSCLNPSTNIVPDISGGTLPYTFLWSTGATASTLEVDKIGTYKLTVTDVNGCTISASKVVNKSLGYPVADAGPDEIYISCATAPNIIGGPNTSIGPDFVYEWRNFVGGIDPGTDITQPFIEATNFGMHILTVTNIVEGCSASDEILVLTDGSFPSVQIQSPPHLACLINQVTLNATGSSAGPQFTYLWTTNTGHIVSGSNTLTPVVDAPGQYILTVTNTLQGCSKTGQAIVIADQGTHIANAGADTGIPCGGGQITLDGGGSSTGPQFVYNWSTANGNVVAGGITMNPIVNQPGIYTLVVTNTQNGCTKTDAVEVFPGPAIPAQDLGVLDVSCTGQLGFVQLTMSQGTGPYTYAWSNGTTTANLVNIQAGTYSVVATDALGCARYTRVNVGQGTPLFTLNATKTDPNCAVGNDGSIDLTVSSTANQIEYAWGTGETTQDVNTLAAGTYIVTVTDFSSCTSTLSVTLVNDPGFSLSAVVQDENTCTNITGAVDLSVTSAGNYTFSWSNGATTEDLTSLTAGTYTVTVSAGGLCSTVGSFAVKDLANPPVVSFAITPATCSLQNGKIVTTIGGGVSPYSYQWSNGSLQEDLINILPGVYLLTVTEANGCTQALSVEVPNNPVAITVSGIVTPNDDCQGNPNGWIDLSVTPAGSYSYGWSTGVTTQDISNIPEGTYTVTVTLGPTCTVAQSFVVPGSQLALSLVPSGVPCTGACIGSIDLTVSAGVAPFTYIWGTGVTSEDVINLCAGTYTVTVIDAKSCTSSKASTVGQLPDLTITTTTIPDECGANGGLIDVAVAGGVGPYTYLWSDGSVFQTILNLTQGTYTVTVTDAAGCTQTASDVIVYTSGITIASQVSNASCGGNDGKIDLSVSGIFSNFNYLWMTGATTEDLVGVAGGTYTITVTQVPGSCTEVATIVVGQQGSSMILSTNTTDATCAGNDGSIDLTVAGGTPLYTFLWTNGSVSEDPASLPFGTYTVTVVDGTGCSQTTSATVGQNSSLTLNAVVLPSTACNLPNGSIDLSATPAGNYNYLWSNGAATEDLNNLAPGNHTVTVDDGSGCSAVKTFNVPDNPDVPNPMALPTGTTCGLSNGSVDVTVTGGVLPYTYLWSNAAITQNLSNIVSGIYNLTVTGGNGCTQQTSVSVLNNNPAISLSGIITASSSCVMENGAVDLDVTPAGNYTYTWSVGTTNQDLTGIGAGAYTVTVSAGGFCTETATYLVPNDANSPVSQITSLSDNCTSETLSGPDQSGVSFTWTGPNGFFDFVKVVTVNIPGVYTLTVTDNMSGCTGTDNYTVNLSGGGTCGFIKGRVFHDEDESCSPDFGEPGLAGWIVRAEGAVDTLYGVTDAQGKYLVGVPVGTYVMKVLVPNGLWSVCPGGAPATLFMAGDTIAGGDFPVQSIYICPALTVSIGINKLRRCFLDNYYQVEYCNTGTQKAENAFVTVVLDPLLTAMSVSVPYVDLGANALKVEVGDLEVGECGSFAIQVYVSCNAALGQAHCTEATIYPDTLCAPTNANWSGASLSIQSVCNSDSLRFTIKNDGKAGMSTSSNYIVVEDGIMFRTGVLPPLAENESMELSVPANGSTWRVEVGQELFHPFPAPVGLSVEACTTSPSFSTGFLNQFPTPDEPGTVDIDCTTNIGSFDPNDKHGYPVGYGADHYIRPGSDIEYLIRFQNTGSDTAFAVQIIDTLSDWLDPATIRFGASSHPYRYDLDGEGVVHFYFENILLPDSTTNQVASNGFAKFIIKPRLDAPLESRIENTAAIYFDFNDPIYTNTTYHRLGNNFITVGLWQPEIPKAQISATPNPFTDRTLLEVKGLAKHAGLRLEVLDIRGKMVQEMESDQAFFELRKGDLQSGIYLFRITQAGKLVGSGKLIAE